VKAVFAKQRSVFTVLCIALLCTSCAISPEAEERRQAAEREIERILSQPVDAGRYGTTQRCLSSQEYRSFRALDNRRILFEGRSGQLWLNTLRTVCLDLRDATVLGVRSYSPVRRICDLDTFQAGDWFDWPWYRRWPWTWGTRWRTGTPCTLGQFQPVTRAQVEAIEAAIRSK
jgi:hypothetical protein